MNDRTLLISTCVLAGAVALAAQAPAPQGRGQGRGPLTPEQQEQQKARQAASGPEAVRPIDALDTVWIEEMTWKILEPRATITATAIRKAIGSAGPTQQ